MKKKQKTYETGDYRGWMVPAWASRAVSLAINVVLLMQINYYCTNALGLEAGITGMVLMASKLFDGVTDLIAGVIVDKTNTRWGKARPYEFCILGVWLCTILLFTTPNIGAVGQYIWLFVFYTLVNSVFATFLNATDAVYLGRAVKDDVGRGKVMSYTGVIIMLGCMVVTISLPQLIVLFGSMEHGWTLISGALGIPLAIIGMGRFCFIKEMEIDSGANRPNVTLRGIWEALRTNKYVFIVAATTLIYQLVTNMSTAVTNYYFQYIYGDLGTASLASMVSLVTPFLMLLIPVLMKKWSLARITKIGIGMLVAGSLIKFAGNGSLIMLMIGGLIAGIGGMPLTTLVNIFLIECMDYGEYKNGTRVEGVYGCINGFMNKIGSGFASGLSGLILSAAGFDGMLAVQSAAANHTIIALFTWVPALLFIVAFFVFGQYDLDKKIGGIRMELEKRRADGK